MAIDISTLSDSDKNRTVVYRGFGVTEWGRIRRWNDRYIFVLYTHKQFNRGQKFERTGSTPEATDPASLEFAE